MITEFRIGFSHTVNLGSFSSAKVEATLTVAVPEGDSFEILKDKAQSELRTLLEETWKAQHRERK